MSNLIYAILPQAPRPIVQVHPDTDVTQCVELMVTHGIGALVVTDDENLLGIVSERDIVWNINKHGENVLKQKSSDILCANVAVLRPTDTIETAMAIITQTKRRHVLVAEEGKLIAIISIGDLLFHLLNEKARVIEHLEQYIYRG